MRRAEERRSASVMIRSSIRWSLAGYDVDCRMKASEPRTFSWISTKISFSAKRRTTVLASGSPRPPAISFASIGLELPATILMAPFLADIEASPRGLLEILSSISDYPRNRRFLPAGHNRVHASLATRWPRFPGQKCEQLLRFG